MPILEVDLVLQPGEDLLPDLTARLARSAAVALGSRTGTTWVRLRPILTDHYAEDSAQTSGRPVFVKVLQADVPSDEAAGSAAAALAQAVARECGREADAVHILFEPGARGRLWFGGTRPV